MLGFFRFTNLTHSSCLAKQSTVQSAKDSHSADPYRFCKFIRGESHAAQRKDAVFVYGRLTTLVDSDLHLLTTIARPGARDERSARRAIYQPAPIGVIQHWAPAMAR